MINFTLMHTQFLLSIHRLDDKFLPSSWETLMMIKYSNYGTSYSGERREFLSLNQENDKNCDRSEYLGVRSYSEDNYFNPVYKKQINYCQSMQLADFYYENEP